VLRAMATTGNIDRIDTCVCDLVKHSWHGYEDASVVVRTVSLSSMQPIARSVKRDLLQRAAICLCFTKGLKVSLAYCRRSSKIMGPSITLLMECIVSSQRENLVLRAC
jgi:glycerol-3-phosphate dehydrogenase